MDNSAVRWLVIGLIVLLLIPLVSTLGMMTMGGMTGSGMMSHMGGMMGGGSWGMMGSTGMFWGIPWLVLVAAALVFLIVLLARNAKPSANRDKAA